MYNCDRFLKCMVVFIIGLFLPTYSKFFWNVVVYLYSYFLPMNRFDIYVRKLWLHVWKYISIDYYFEFGLGNLNRKEMYRYFNWNQNDSNTFIQYILAIFLDMQWIFMGSIIYSRLPLCILSHLNECGWCHFLLSYCLHLFSNEVGYYFSLSLPKHIIWYE